ncbi:MAG: GNAT family N-acetyltransferase [Candidatus Eremiobacteraeota bacterium]|nr:GNAT family N-acetyltransferase [Candidatus Eremiobacteraeota bacterium]
MGEISTRLFNEEDLNLAEEMMTSAWKFYLQETTPERLRQLLEDQLENPASKVWLVFENDNPIGIAEISITESYRYDGEEALLKLIFISDTASNYYDVHSALMDTIFGYLRDEGIDYLRVDTTLENADVLLV